MDYSYAILENRIKENIEMKCVLMSDTHGIHEEVINGKSVSLKIPDGDVLVHCGDFSNRGTYLDVINFSNFLGLLPHKSKYVVGGNHDEFVEQDFNASQSLLTEAVLFTHHKFNIGNISCFASSYQPFYNNWSFNIKDDSKRKELFAMIPNETEMLFSHCPPYGFLDKGFKEAHAGDKMLMGRIRELKKLKYVVFGHLHNNYGKIEQDGITYINCSLLNDRYELVNKPVILEV